MQLSKKQVDKDREFCTEIWNIWKEYGAGTDGSEPTYWEEVTNKLNQLAKGQLEIDIAMAMLQELKRRSI